MATKNLAYEILTGDSEGRICKDIPAEACEHQPGNFTKHVLSLAATKMGDGLADPKLVLSWLLANTGAPEFLIGLLVPVREAGSLLPQLATAGSIRALPQRKWAWSGGSLVQGLAVIGMGVAALWLEGAAAGWTVVGLLGLFALARSVCSVSYKDVLGKTVSKTTRGTATGTAGTMAAAVILAVGISMSVGLIPVSIPVIAVFLFAAGGLWMVGAAIFATLNERPGATDGGGNPLTVAVQQLSLLRTDPQLVRFIITRGLLTATALAPPYLLAMAGRESERELGELGLFIVAASLAAVSSMFFWGRLADVSSRKVLVGSATLAGLALGTAGVIGLTNGDVLGSRFVLPAVLFLLMVAYQGVRLGRSTQITDMAAEDTRAAYTALSNTILGLLLLAGGLFGAVAQMAGEAVVLTVFAGMCVAAAVAALGLREVQ